MVLSAFESRPELMRKLDNVGCYFNDNGVLEHTWTTSTVPQINLALSKLRFLHRPESIPRYVQDGIDSRGLPTFRIIDGTNKAEASFGELEKPISANGGYSRDKFDGKLLNKIGRMNERERVSQAGGSGPGHYNLKRARLHNALMASLGEPLPHPSLPQLAPRAQTKHATFAFDRAVALQRSRGDTSSAPLALPPPSLALAPSIDFAQPVDGVSPAKEPRARKREREPESDGGIDGGGGVGEGGGSGRGGGGEGEQPVDLPGIQRPDHKTAGIGKLKQLQWNLKREPLCHCAARGKSSTHAAGCEHGIISDAKKSNGYDREGKKIRG